MFKYWLQFLFLIFPMFAAGAAADAAGGGDGAGSGGADGAGDGGGGADENADLGGDGSGDGGDDALDADLGDGAADADKGDQHADADKETSDFKGLVSKRLLALKKDAPELTAVFQKYPKVQEQVEAAFRRDMAYRELYPTIAEARQMREHFPNGMADVEQLHSEIAEVEELDRSFYGRDAQGQFSGHADLIQNWHRDDPQVMSSLFRTAVQLMPRLDQDTYREVGGAIVAATLTSNEIPEWLAEVRDAAKAAKQDGIAASLDKMLRWAQGFGKRKAEPTEEERRIQGQREQFRRETEERGKQDFSRFNQTFVSDSNKLQQSIIRKHPAVAELMTTKAISDQKKAEIIGKIQKAIQNHLKSAPSFMKKLTPLYKAANLKEALDLQRVAWSYPWVLNKFVRQVMAEETPNLVNKNRQRTGTQQRTAQNSRQADGKGTQREQQKPTKPYKEGNRWLKANGQPYSTSEILRGVHLKDGATA